MKLRSFSIFIISLILTISMTDCTQTIPEPPETKRDDVVDTIHGVAIADPYRWLEDQECPETREWLEKQNEYTISFLDKVKAKDRIEQRYNELLKVDFTSIPSERGNRYFFSKRGAEQELSIICMRESVDGENIVLIDPHGMSAEHNISVHIMETSSQGELLIYGIRKGGEDEVSVRIFDVDKKTDLPDSLPWARYHGMSILPDLSGMYYTKFSEVGGRIYYHEMGTDIADDILIFGEGYDPGKIIFSDLTDDGKYLIVHVLYGSAADQTEVYIHKTGSKKFTTVVNDVKGRFFAGEYNDDLYLVTNYQASNYRILRTPIKQLPSHPDTWEEIIPESDGIVQTSSGIAGGKLLVLTLENVVSKARIYTPDGEHLSDIDLPSLGTVAGLSYKKNSPNLFYSFTSYHIPPTSYMYNLETGAQEVWSELDLDIDQENIDVKQVWYESKDGTSIPMFVVHKKGLELDGNNPLFITGYGGFNVNETAGFSATAVMWAENGGIFAAPNLRGGGEFGEEWHKAGMLENKQNVFDDFYAATEWFIDNNYTNPARIACSGGSNGGLLVGAALTQRPDLYKAIICTYPLLDMIRYHQFMVARFWVPEYGSSEDPEQFKYILKYSPYHNVKEGAEYPATLFMSGDGDTRVAPLHARKMAALMQHANGANTPMLLDYDTKAGHSGGAALSKTIEDATKRLSFLVWQLDMDFE